MCVSRTNVGVNGPTRTKARDGQPQGSGEVRSGTG